MYNVLYACVFLWFFGVLGGYAIAQNNTILIGIGGEINAVFNQYNNETFVGYNHTFSNSPFYNYGVSFDFYNSKRLGFHSGVFMASKGYKLDYDWNTNGVQDPLLPKQTSLESKYVEIPVEVSYSFIKNKADENKISFELGVGTGFVFSALLNEKEVSIMGDDSYKQTNYFKNSNTKYLLLWKLGFKGQVLVSSSFSVLINPFVSTNIVSLNKDIVVSPPWGLGCFVGVGYNINK